MRSKLATTLASLAVTGMTLSSCANPADDGRISSPGQYEGYSEVVYDGWELSSQYVPVRDGTRLAVDIIRPTLNGEVVDDPLPVVWMHTPYNRRARDADSAAITYPSGPIELVGHGYVVAVADFRGLYASFGQNRLFNFGNFLEPAWTDAYDITEWLAEQPWSSGNIGMWGCSATGGSQHQAMVTQPPSLKAIVALSPAYDTYDFVNFGGIPSVAPYDPVTSAERDAAASPVDGPDGEALLEQAKAEHIDDPVSIRSGELPYRDSVSAALGDWWGRSSMYTYHDEIENSGVAVYSGGNWDEAGTKIAPGLMFANMPEGRGKLIYGPAEHCRWNVVEEETGLSITTEQLRFFDHWLKGVENGVMEEPSVTYYTYNAPAGREWQQADSWPLANEQRTTYFLSDGGLSLAAPAGGQVVTQTGAAPVVTSVTIEPPEGGLVFETEPLAADMQVTGYPVVNLWIDARTSDADATAQLLDVAPDGTTRTYEMVGRLRASHRQQGEAPYNNLGLPFHTHREADIQPLVPGTPAELEFAMLPMSYNFPAGHRVRLVLSFANPDGADGDVAVLTGGEQASTITLPIIPAD